MDLLSKTVGDLVAEDYRKATIFKKYGIDFCCGGGQTVSAACTKKGVSVDVLIDELSRLEGYKNEEETEGIPEEIIPKIEHVSSTYHSYFHSDLPILKEFLHKVARVHGNGNPEVVAISDLFDLVVVDLNHVIEHYEKFIFPSLLMQIQESAGGDRNNSAATATLVERTCESISSRISRIQTLSSEYNPPEYACATYRVTYAKLAEFHEIYDRYVRSTSRLGYA